MKFNKIIIKNYKGIENATLDLSNNPKGNIYTLVGINESGKTSLLEAINLFRYNLSSNPSSTIKTSTPDYNSIIPIKAKANFNDDVTISGIFELTDEEKKMLKEWTKNECKFNITEDILPISITQIYRYTNSIYNGSETKWDFELIGKSVNSRVSKNKPIDEENKNKCKIFLEKMIPNILYFPTALFDWPDKLYLDGEKEDDKNVFFKAVIQDILDSLNKDMNIKTHIVDRILSGNQIDKDNVNQTSLLISRQLNNVILKEWSGVLGNNKSSISLNVIIDKDEKGVYLEFQINDEDGIFKLSERSMGFRWFFVFLLLTKFRGYRSNENNEVIFLFDEPAANLSQMAQTRLLKSLEKIGKNCIVIYSTHSQYLINPKWLENAFIVTNDALKKDDDKFNANNTNIKVERYRTFVNSHPNDISYYQPILDVLEYAPSNLEICNTGIILEGKYDYYTLNYMFKIILNKPEIKLIPGTNSENSSTLISLYLGWGKEFFVFLDSDKGGKEGKKNYLDKFGEVVSNKIFDYEDIDPSWKKKNIEKILPNSEKLLIQQKVFPNMVKYSKSSYNKAIQELYMNNIKIDLKQETINNFEKIYNFMKNL